MAKTEAKAETKKDPLIKVNRDNYQNTKTSSGGKSLNNGDLVASGIQGLNIDEVFEVADKFGVAKDGEDLQKKYKHLNGGMQRMNLGNRIRGRITAIDKAAVKAIAKAKTAGKDGGADDKAVAKAEGAKSGADQLTAILTPFTKARDKRDADAQKASDAKAKETAKKKAAEDKKAA